MKDDGGLARSEYVSWCALLGVAFDASLRPLERRRALPAWMSAELVCTDAARAKLRRWVELGKPLLGRRVTDRDLVTIGLSRGGLRGALVGAVHRLPPPVRHYVLHHAWCRAYPQGVGLGSSEASRGRGSARAISVQRPSDSWGPTT